MRRIGEVITIAATSAALLSGDTAQPTLEQMAPDARVAIAARYASCNITGVNLNTTVIDEVDRHPRNNLTVTVEVEKSTDALRYERVFAEDDTVMWLEPVGGEAFVNLGDDKNAKTEHGLGLPVVEPGPFGTGMSGNASSGRFRFVPRNNYKTGDHIDIYVTNHALTYDFDDNQRAEAVGFTYCGSLEATSDGERVTQWTNLGHLLELTSFVVARECDLDTEDGVQYRDECSDWHKLDR